MQPLGIERDTRGQPLAVTAEALYLVNMLPAPGLGFLVLVWLYLRNRETAPSLALCHLWQAIVVSLWGGVLIGLVGILILVLGGLDEPASWAAMILYVLCIHSAFILFGVVALAKAMAGESYRYPLIGPRNPSCGPA